MRTAIGLPASIGTKSNVDVDSTQSVTILAGNDARVGGTLFNDSTQVAYVSLGSGASSSTSYTIKMDAAGYYEFPYAYTGPVSARWAGVDAAGKMRVTELV